MSNHEQPNNNKTIDEYESFKNNSQKLGARILAQTGFENRHKRIVESSFNKSLKKGEKLPGKNAERRNYSYLNRISKLVEKYGNKAEQALWEKSSKKLIITSDDILDSYWRAQEQILRDSGQGRKLSDYEKQLLIADIQKTQEDSLKSWSSYLGSEESPYPMWFKIYAWDGMSKMGVFDKEKGQFAKRDKHTVAPYPKLNPAVLAKVHRLVDEFYGEKSTTDGTDHDAELAALTKSGNFNKLYSKILLAEKIIPKTPERTEDVHGEWIEYLPGEEEKLANAAEGTPWCVADPGTGRNYLEHGNYGGWEDDEYDEDDYGDNYGGSDNNLAKFILFHLKDPETNLLSETACASIRLDPDGYVAEISGLNEGQALEDSLVPIVEKKVKTLPGGERFLKAFADKQKLITLDRKMQNSENLTKEELEFIYEINRPIVTLDTYNSHDPRIDELKEQYGIEYALGAGIDANDLIESLDRDDVIDNTQLLLDHGASTTKIMWLMDHNDFLRNIDVLAEHGADISGFIDDLTEWPDLDIVFEKIDTLKKYNNNIDINDLIHHLSGDYIKRNYNKILSRDDIDVADVLDCIPGSVLIHNFDEIVGEYGVDPSLLVRGAAGYFRWREEEQKPFLINALEKDANPDTVLEEVRFNLRDEPHIIKLLIEKEVDQDKLFHRLGDYYLKKNVDELMEDGADGAKIAQYLSDGSIVGRFEKLISHGADPNLVAENINSISEYEASKKITTLLDNGVSMDLVVAKLEYGVFVKQLKLLTERGLDLNTVNRRVWIGPWNIDEAISSGANIDAVARLYMQEHKEEIDERAREVIQRLVESGASIDNITNEIPAKDMIRDLDYYVNLGASVDGEELLNKLDLDSYSNNVLLCKRIESLTRNGVDGRDIVSKIRWPSNIIENLDRFTEAGVTFTNEEIATYVKKSDPNSILENLDKLEKYGDVIDFNEVVKKADRRNLWRYPLDYFLEKGVRIDVLVDAMDDTTGKLLNQFIEYGADIEQVVSKLSDLTKIERHNDLEKMGSR